MINGFSKRDKVLFGLFPFKKKVPLPFMLLSRNDGTCTDERWKLKIGYDIIRASEQEFAGAGMETVSMPEQVPVPLGLDELLRKTQFRDFRIRPCLINGEMRSGERIFRQSRPKRRDRGDFARPAITR